MTKRKKTAMLDLTVDPKGDNVQEEVRKREERLHKKMLVDNEYDKRFSMFSSKGRAVAFSFLAIAIFLFIYFLLNIILKSSPTNL
jgi:hypothetical protein